MDYCGQKIVATGEQGDFRVFVQDMLTDAAVVASYPSKIIQSVNTTHLYGRRLALGAESRACLVEDVDQPLIVKTFRTKSDVLSLCQEDHLLYAGLRAGSLLRYDLREPHPPSAHSASLRSQSQTSSPIVSLSRLRQWEMIVGYMDGAIEILDLRFPIPIPVLSLRGHANAWKSNLPFALMPSSDILFAAGLDARIRAWSTRTGALLSPSPSSPSTTSSIDSPATSFANPLSAHFEQPPAALRVVDLGGRARLFAAAGREVLLWTLG